MQESEPPAGEGTERCDTEAGEGIPVGRIPSDQVRELVQALYSISAELYTALCDTHLPPGLVALCHRAGDAASDIAVLEGKDLERDAVDLSLFESRRIREAVDAYAAYTHERAQADEPGNAEFWALHFSGRHPLLSWLEDEPPAQADISPGGEDAAAKLQVHGQAPSAERAQEIARLGTEEEETRRPEGSARERGDQPQAAQQEGGAPLAGMQERVTSAGEGSTAEQPEGEKIGQEGSQAEGESMDWLPVGLLESAHLRRLQVGLEDLAFELYLAPLDVRFPASMLDQCGQAWKLARECSELLERKDLAGEEADLSLSESQQIAESISAYAGYTVERAEVDDAANKEFWAVKFSGRCLPLLPWIASERPSEP